MLVFPSTLIIAKNENSLNHQINQICQQLNHQFNPNNPDIFLINENSGWGIDEVRKISNFLSQKPFSHQSKIVIINQAHHLNTEAQNALLKILEEPGDNNYLILTTNKIKTILPTIISRCQTTKILNHEKTDIKSQLIITGHLQTDLLLSEKLSKNKEEVLPLLESELHYYQQQLINSPTPSTSDLIEKIIKAIQMINANVDPKSALDFIFLS